MEIKLDNVTKYYQDSGKSTKGIEDVSLTFKTDGSFVVITGESGAGKSTLIRILTGLEDFDEGEISFDGEPLSGMNDAKRVQMYANNISFVFQDYNLVESFTSEENVILALLKQGMELKQAKKKAVEALTRVGLTDQIKMKTSRLSGGERQRVAIARSLALDTKVIIFDEPTGNLDQETSKSIIDLIDQVKGDRLIIYVTHEFYQVQDYVTRHIVLADGHVIKDEEIRKAQNQDNASKADGEKKKFSIKSYIYSSCLFSFRRIGRFIATFIAMALAVGVMFSGAVVSAATLILQGSLQSSKTDQNMALFGNDLTVKKAAYDEKDTSFENALGDNLGLLRTTGLKLYSSAKVDTYTPSAGVSLAPSLACPLGVVSTFLDKLTLIAGEDNKPSEDKAYIILQAGSAKSFSDYYTESKALLNLKQKMSYIGYSFSTESALAVKAFLSQGPEVTIAGIYETSSALVNYSQGMLLVSKSKAEEVSQYLSSVLGKNPNCGAISAYQSTDTYSFAAEDAEGNNINWQNSSYFLQAVSNGYASEANLFISKNYEGQDISIEINGVKIPVSALDNVTYFSPSLSTYEMVYADAALQVAANKFALYKDFQFESAKEAEDGKALLDKNGTESYLHAAYQVNIVKAADINKMDVLSRVSTMFVFAGALVDLFILMLIIRAILNKFYYRKDDDQKVLTYIGYSLKDMVIINLMEFVTISVVTIVAFYVPMVLCVSAVNQAFNLLPGLFVTAIVFSLLFAVITALPKRRRHN